jgi:predicted nucleic acid-binding protein
MGSMEVFLIPVGGEAYELYCEVQDEDPSGGAPDHDRGFFRGLIRKFRDTMNRIEYERHHHEEEEPQGWWERLKRRGLRLVAESIAEQRLLWHLRRQHEVVAVHPEDLSDEAAMAVVRPALQADFEKHRRWLVIDSLLLALSGLLMLVPGPNVLAYYFAFRVVGHFFSMRGARQGLDRVRWTTRASDALADLRPLVPVDPEERRSRVEAIAARLQLLDLRRFFDRVAVPGA